MGPFGQPKPQVDLGADIGLGYQQHAATKIEQARVDARKAYTGGYAKKYGVSNVAATVKGKTDTDIYEMAANLVNKRRGIKPGATAPGQPSRDPRDRQRGRTPSPAPRKRRRRTPTTRNVTAARRPAPQPTTRRRRRRTTTAAVPRASYLQKMRVAGL